jgi:hypothetical protein
MVRRYSGLVFLQVPGTFCAATGADRARDCPRSDPRSCQQFLRHRRTGAPSARADGAEAAVSRAVRWRSQRFRRFAWRHRGDLAFRANSACERIERRELSPKQLSWCRFFSYYA